MLLMRKHCGRTWKKAVVEITGEKLNVEKLDMQEGILVVSGKIISVQYTDKNKKEKTSIFKKFSRV